jgi:hypothetical protein
MNIYLKNKGTECKTGPVWGWVLEGGEGEERGKGGEYGRCTLYCKKITQ